MFALGALTPSDLAELRDALGSPDVQNDVVKAVRSFLTAHPIDGGADDDQVFMVGRRLANAGMWDQISATKLAAGLRQVSISSIKLFLETVPQYQAAVVRSTEHLPAMAFAPVTLPARPLLSTPPVTAIAVPDPIVSKHHRKLAARIMAKRIQYQADHGLILEPVKIEDGPGQYFVVTQGKKHRKGGRSGEVVMVVGTTASAPYGVSDGPKKKKLSPSGKFR